MTEIENFDDYVRRAGMGRRLDPAVVAPEVVAGYEPLLMRTRSFIESARRGLPRLPPVYADFVNNSEFNAIATRHNGMHLIAFHDGLPATLSLVLSRMLADRRIFRKIGNPDEERENLSPLPVSADAKRLYDAAPLVVPVNARRRDYAVHLMEIGYDFLSAHELTHIVHGHVDYIIDERGLAALGELDWLPGTPEGSLERQTIEMDADFNATKLLMQTVKRVMDSRHLLMPHQAPFYESTISPVFDAAVVICTLFRLFGDSQLTGVDMTRRTHPPLRWRQMMILNTVGNYVEHLWDETLVAPASEAFTRAIDEVEAAFEIITDGKQKVDGLHDVWGPTGFAYAKTLTDCWDNKLKAKLKKHAFINGEMPHYGFDFPARVPGSSP